MSDIEKRGSDSSSALSKDEYYTREVLVDPEEKESLHRDLSARQISMIAVRSVCALTPSLVCQHLRLFSSVVQSVLV